MVFDLFSFSHYFINNVGSDLNVDQRESISKNSRIFRRIRERFEYKNQKYSHSTSTVKSSLLFTQIKECPHCQK